MWQWIKSLATHRAGSLCIIILGYFNYSSILFIDHYCFIIIYYYYFLLFRHYYCFIHNKSLLLSCFHKSFFITIFFITTSPLFYSQQIINILLYCTNPHYLKVFNFILLPFFFISFISLNLFFFPLSFLLFSLVGKEGHSKFTLMSRPLPKITEVETIRRAPFRQALPFSFKSALRRYHVRLIYVRVNRAIL